MDDGKRLASVFPRYIPCVIRRYSRNEKKKKKRKPGFANVYRLFAEISAATRWKNKDERENGFHLYFPVFHLSINFADQCARNASANTVVYALLFFLSFFPPRVIRARIRSVYNNCVSTIGNNFTREREEGLPGRNYETLTNEPAPMIF